MAKSTRTLPVVFTPDWNSSFNPRSHRSRRHAFPLSGCVITGYRAQFCENWKDDWGAEYPSDDDKLVWRQQQIRQRLAASAASPPPTQPSQLANIPPSTNMFPWKNPASVQELWNGQSPDGNMSFQNRWWQDVALASVNTATTTPDCPMNSPITPQVWNADYVSTQSSSMLSSSDEQMKLFSTLPNVDCETVSVVSPQELQIASGDKLESSKKESLDIGISVVEYLPFPYDGQEYWANVLDQNLAADSLCDNQATGVDMQNDTQIEEILKMLLY